MNMFSSIYRQFVRHRSSGSLRSNPRNDPWYSGEHCSINLRQPRAGRQDSAHRPTTLDQTPVATSLFVH